MQPSHFELNRHDGDECSHQLNCFYCFNLQELGRDSSRMEQALQDFTGFVDRLDRGIMGVEPLVNQSFMHAEALRQQASDLDK